MRSTFPTLRPTLLLTLAACALSACATFAPPPAAPSARPAGAPQGQPQPFAAVVKDAKRSDGLIPVWQKDDKFWLELAPEHFDKPFFLSPKIARGIGEAGLFGGSMASRFAASGGPQLVEFRRVHNQVQLVARNSEFVARAGTPEARAVEAGFSASLVASAPVASQPHPEHKGVLVEANGLFLGDLFGLGMALNRAYRQGYGLDRANSAILAVRNKPELLVFETQAHFATASLATAPPGAPAGAPVPQTPRALPDPRSMFFGLHYSLARLPDEPMKGRLADPRVGYFTTNVHDFGDDLARTPRVRYVNRWRLDKKDPAAALSEPVKPITFWLDRNIPLKYRDAIARGILEWNKAFERIGFKDALVVKVQPDDADFDTLDLGVASVRWMTNARPSFGAIGPSHVDPRSGEILDADIGFESLSSRGLRALRSQILSAKVAIDWPELLQARPAGDRGHGAPGHAHDPLACTHAEHASEQLGYALDVLEARGHLEPGSPEAERFVLDYLTDTTMHEVGHTLGLRHNFRSSRVYTAQQVADPEFTRKHGLAGSVMEYAPINLPAPGEVGGTPFQLTLGPYDYWAIEYGYKPFHPDHEAAELKRVAARSSEPELAYGTDEDNFLGIDPEALHFDLGDDPVLFAKKRIATARELVKRQETRPLEPTEDYSVLRRGVTFALRDVGRSAGILARQIGGVRTLRDFPGSGRDPLQPVPAAVQRDALDTLARTVLAPDTFLLSPALQRRLAPDFSERTDAVFAGEPVATDFSVQTVLLDMQRALLSQLMSDAVAGRILDSEPKVRGQADAFRLSELYGRLAREVWGELGARGDIPLARRELQREHLNRLAGALLRPSGGSRADARSLLRVQATELARRIAVAGRRADLTPETRAHLTDSAETLQQVLSAKLQRAGV